MGTSSNIPVRCARNRIIDLLEIGDTYPLNDLNVDTSQLKVAYGGKAKIPIENAQLNVTYQLCNKKGDSLGDEYRAEGKGATLMIETPEVTEDVTYRIQATKSKVPGSTLEQQESRFLDKDAPVKVGIVKSLVIGFTEEQNLAPLDPDKPFSSPRIVAYGTSVDVQVEKTQEGVKYSLIVGGNKLEEEVAGNRGNIVLATGAVHEDAIIQVHATRHFPASANKDSESTELKAKLYLKVRANPTLTVSVEPSPIVDYGQGATIRIAAPQQGIKYLAYMAAIADADFVHGDASSVDVAQVVVAEGAEPHEVQVRKPPRSESWQTPAGYVPLGDEPVSGSGGDIEFDVTTLNEDSLVIVQALKEHQAETKPASTIVSSICLEQAAAILLRPDPARALNLRLPLLGTKTGETMQVSDGQPGVFYYFRPAPDGAEFPLPAYFHKRDTRDPAQNKGVGQLGMEIDFVVADDPPAPVLDPATTSPRLPNIGITPVATGSKLAVRAVKAQTKVEVAMVQDALIAKVPKIHADADVLEYGASATIRIPASKANDQYQLMLDGAPVKPSMIGDGKELAVETDPLITDTIFEMVVTRHDKGWQVERVVHVPVWVQPDTSLLISLSQDILSKGDETNVIVYGTQQGVDYQLMSGETAIGPALPGTGADIALPSGPILADTDFFITATRSDKPDIVVELDAQVSVTLEAEE